MQWLINIITALFTNRHRFFDRGDSGFDFGVGDFTRDNTWHDLDLSAIVPANAVAVLLYFNIRATAINEIMFLRRKGHVGFGASHQLHTQVANQRIDSPSVTIALDPDRFLQYKVKSVNVNSIEFAVRGWWLE